MILVARCRLTADPGGRVEKHPTRKLSLPNRSTGSFSRGRRWIIRGCRWICAVPDPLRLTRPAWLCHVRSSDINSQAHDLTSSLFDMSYHDIMFHKRIYIELVVLHNYVAASIKRYRMLSATENCNWIQSPAMDSGAHARWLAEHRNARPARVVSILGLPLLILLRPIPAGLACRTDSVELYPLAQGWSTSLML